MHRRQEQGFSFIDVMIAMAILLIGVLAFAAALTAAIVRTEESEEMLRAKQVASSTLESIFSAREISALGWAAIVNADDRFPAGPQDVYDSSGADRVFGTPDDQSGSDGVLGNADDGALLRGFQRTVSIVSVLDDDFDPPADNRKQIVVTVTFVVGGATRTITLGTEIANYRTSTS